MYSVFKSGTLAARTWFPEIAFAWEFNMCVCACMRVCACMGVRVCVWMCMCVPPGYEKLFT